MNLAAPTTTTPTTKSGSNSTSDKAYTLCSYYQLIKVWITFLFFTPRFPFFLFRCCCMNKFAFCWFVAPFSMFSQSSFPPIHAGTSACCTKLVAILFSIHFLFLCTHTHTHAFSHSHSHSVGNFSMQHVIYNKRTNTYLQHINVNFLIKSIVVVS